MTQRSNTKMFPCDAVRRLLVLLILGSSLMYVGCCQTPTGVGWVIITATPDREQRVRYFAAAIQRPERRRPDFENPADWDLAHRPEGYRTELSLGEVGFPYYVFQSFPFLTDVGVVSGIRRNDTTNLSIIAMDLQSIPLEFSETVDLIEKHQWGSFTIIEDHK